MPARGGLGMDGYSGDWVMVPAWIVVRPDGPKRALFWHLPFIRIQAGVRFARLSIRWGTS